MRGRRQRKRKTKDNECPKKKKMNENLKISHGYFVNSRCKTKN